MLSSAFKKLANQHGMSIDRGVAYGSLHGYASTLFDGSGTKIICISTTFTDPALMSKLQAVLNSRDLMRDFRVKNLSFSQKSITIIFHDTVGTMNKINDFIAWFYPMLPEHGATGVNVCPDCGCDIVGGTWKLIDGIAHHFHEACAEKVKASLVQEAETRTREDTGSYLSGFIGAILGAAVGGIVWALLLMVGYIASIVGLLIGWLSERGYRLLRGKSGKGKVVILIIAVIFGVLFGTLLGDGIALAQMINRGELPGYNYSDIPYIFSLVLADSTYLAGTAKNVLMGLLFAALGVFSIIRRSAKEVSAVRVLDLK